jgi:(p)ppGpp synthase/HD superfamily hydrolase
MKKHLGQCRKVSGAPYVTHPISVSYIVAQFKKSKHLDELLAAAILHDTLEDTDTTFIEIAQEFTPLVASLVFDLTSDSEEVKRLGKNEYLKRKLVGLSNYALLLKLADRLHNVTDSPTSPYKQDTVELMSYLEEHRQLTKAQKSLVDEIRSHC